MGTKGEITNVEQNKEVVLHWHSVKNKITKAFGLEEEEKERKRFSVSSVIDLLSEMPFSHLYAESCTGVAELILIYFIDLCLSP